MHDLSAHLRNIYVSLPHHTKNKELVKKQIKLAHGDKDTPRCADTRASVLKLLSVTSQREMGHHQYDLLNTFAEMQKLLYAPEETRTPRAVLRTHLICFRHAKLTQTVFGMKPGGKKMTRRKMYGAYYHSLTVHAPQAIIVISGKSIHVERQESCFGVLKGNLNKY